MRTPSFLYTLLLTILSALTLSSAFAQAIPEDQNARVNLISEYSAVPENGRVYLALEMTLRDGWHVYWRNPGDAGLPPEIIWSNTPDGAEIGPFSWPVPKELLILEGELMDYGYDDYVVLPFSVKLPAQSASRTWEFEGEADYLICKDVCIPEVQKVSLTLNMSDFPTPNDEGGATIQAALAQAPTAFSGQASLTQDDEFLYLDAQDPTLAQARRLRFYPYGNEIFHAAIQGVDVGSLGARLTLQKAKKGRSTDKLAGVLAVHSQDGTIFGYRIGATPGPALNGVTGTKLAAVSASDNRASPTETGQPSSLALILLFAFLGGLVLNIMPCVLPVLAFKAFGMLSAAGSGDHAKLRLHGILYTAGVLICFLALALLTLSIRSLYGVASWGQWMQSPFIVSVLVFAILIAGLWMFGALNMGGSLQNVGQNLAHGSGARSAFFGGVLAASAGAPCVGPFLGVAIGALFTQAAWVLVTGFAVIGLGLASPFLLLSFVPAWTKYIPKPGAWMEYTKQALAFPMFLTATWLTITLGYLSSPETVAYVIAGGIGLVFVAWLSSLGTGGRTLKILGLIIAAGSVSVPLFVVSLSSASNTAITTTADASSAKVAWSAEAVQTALDGDQGVFIDFTAKWCATCQVNKRTTMNTDGFRNLLREHNIVFMEADFTRPDALIAAELQKHSRAGVPMYLYYPPGLSDPITLPEVLSIALVRDTIENSL